MALATLGLSDRPMGLVAAACGIAPCGVLRVFWRCVVPWRCVAQRFADWRVSCVRGRLRSVRALSASLPTLLLRFRLRL